MRSTRRALSPTVGTPFAPTDDVPDADDKVLLSDSLWRRRFGASTSVIGTRIVLDGRQHIVIHQWWTDLVCISQCMHQLHESRRDQRR